MSEATKLLGKLNDQESLVRPHLIKQLKHIWDLRREK